MAPSPTIRRLLKETQELSAAAKHPNPTFHAAPLSEDNLHEWHFTLLGPPAPSPYAGGIYHGRITLPPAYPMKPPNFRFLTPSGRFEVNREICLSISGFHEETWQPAWGVRLALTALRGFMGEEGTAGQVGGLESPRPVRERLARESKGWKCAGCGGDDEGENQRGWTNEQRMQWWWEICRSKGVDVEAEVQDMATLPEGMKLEAREVKNNDKSKQKEVVEDKDANKTNADATAESQRLEQGGEQQVSTVSLVSPALPNPSQESSSPNTFSSTGDSTIPTQPPIPQQQLLQQQQVRQIQPRPADSPISIDRAITVVFLALCLMILKRLFYPSSSGSLFGGYDDLRMLRE